MREIKFRAWDRKLGKWFYPVIDYKQNRIFYDRHAYAESDMDVFELNEKFDMVEYTGLKDKNGKEIWEGDVVKLAGRNETITSINYLDGGFKVEQTNYRKWSNHKIEPP